MDMDLMSPMPKADGEDEGGKPALGDKMWMLREACSRGDHRLVQEICEDDGQGIRGIDKAKASGWTALHYAAYKGHAECARILCQFGAGVNRTTHNKGHTPLHLAVANGHAAAARELIDNGADIRFSNSMGFSPLHMAACNDHISCVKLLVDAGASPESSSKNGLTVDKCGDIKNSNMPWYTPPPKEPRPEHISDTEGPMLQLMIMEMKEKARVLTEDREKKEMDFSEKQRDRIQRRQARRKEFQTVIKMNSAETESFIVTQNHFVRSTSKPVVTADTVAAEFGYTPKSPTLSMFAPSELDRPSSYSPRPGARNSDAAEPEPAAMARLPPMDRPDPSRFETADEMMRAAETAAKDDSAMEAVEAMWDDAEKTAEAS